MTVASRWPLPDRRTAAQLAQDQEDVRRQVSKLAAANVDPAARQEQDVFVQRILRRQRAADAAQATDFVHFLLEPGGDRASLAAAGDLVVDATPQAARRLADLLRDYEPADRPGRSRHRRTRVFRSRGKNAAALRADARRLCREDGVTANINAIVPLGYVTKGNSYPGSTVAPAPFATNGATAPVRVALIDTGITAQPRDDGWDSGVVREGTDPINVLAPFDRIDWFAGHGTFSTGIVRQIAPDADVSVYRFTTTDGLGTDEAAADMLIKAAEDAGGERLIINASFGAPAVDGIPPLAMQEAVAHIAAEHPNTLIVASAGNDGRDLPLYPAAFPGVKAVGALNSDLTPATFTNRGTWVHCAAVGVGIISTFVEGKLPPEDNIGTDVTFGPDSWATWSGTSFSAPQISGAVAALCGEDPSLTPHQAFNQLIAGRPTAPGLGAVVHILPGTPV
ncbi:S8/S53 family peptidase [Actinoplanes sp. TFC3]|uniref:S8/S53 family peptidase n=1 Tax=Actinoplanes sp. TFC3 TaxID=1710355 RepID=UPI000836B4B7|nr:S8/S53 family peptidase [Actinoplanes sp. TFC3]